MADPVVTAKMVGTKAMTGAGTSNVLSMSGAANAAGHGGPEAAAIARLETALRHLEALVAERDAEIGRLRRVEMAATQTLTALDAYLDTAAAAPCLARPARRVAVA